MGTTKTVPISSASTVPADKLASMVVTVRATVSKATPYLTDRNLSIEVNSTLEVLNEGRYRKNRFPTGKGTKWSVISRCENAIRDYVRLHSLNSVNRGVYMVPLAGLKKFQEGLDTLINAYYRAVDDFLDPVSFHKEMESHRPRLGRAYCEEDYGEGNTWEERLNDLRSKFNVDLSVVPLATVSNVLDLAFENVAGVDTEASRNYLIEQTRTSLEKTFREAQMELWDRLFENVVTIKRSLNNERNKQMTEAQHKGLLELLDVMDTLNIANDANLTKVTAELREFFQNITPEDVKLDAVCRYKADEALQRALNAEPMQAVQATAKKQIPTLSDSAVELF